MAFLCEEPAHCLSGVASGWEPLPAKEPCKSESKTWSIPHPTLRVFVPESNQFYNHSIVTLHNRICLYNVYIIKKKQYIQVMQECCKSMVTIWNGPFVGVIDLTKLNWLGAIAACTGSYTETNNNHRTNQRKEIWERKCVSDDRVCECVSLCVPEEVGSSEKSWSSSGGSP